MLCMSSEVTSGDTELHTLIEQFRAGDRQAFGELVERNNARLLAFLASLGPVGVAIQNLEDIAQETWLRVWNHRHDYREQNFRAWLFTIARRIRIDDVRRMIRARNVPFNDHEPLPPSTDGDAIEREERFLALRECFQELDAACVQTVHRVKIMQIAPETIAEEEGVAVSTIYTRIHRGTAQLGECIQRKLSSDANLG
jgi:RNA polymerase sigma-70 factor (ECF subfamily)